MYQSLPKRDGIPQLEKFLFLIGNETGWDRICQSHSRPAYVIGIKKCPTHVPNFFYGTKICPNPVPNGMRSCVSGKIVIPRSHTSFLCQYGFENNLRDKASACQNIVGTISMKSEGRYYCSVKGIDLTAGSYPRTMIHMQ